jgi:hypothetical protein
MNALRFGGLTLGILVLSQPLLLFGAGHDGRSRAALLLGGILAALHAVAVYGCACWAAPRSTRALLWAVLGGMTVRMVVLLPLLAAAITLARLPAMPLVLSLVAYFALFLTVELIALPRIFGVVTQ